MAAIRNPFNPMRFTGNNGLLTLEEASRLQDLIKGAGDAYTRTLNQILSEFNIAITNVTTTPGPQGQAGVPGQDGADGEDGRPGRDGAAGQRGDRGAPGSDGQDGDDGWMGPPGAAGARGSAGSPGQDGADGEDAPAIPGPRGPAGRDGVTMMLEVPAGDDDLFVPPSASSAGDLASFHFFIDYTTPGGGSPVGKLVPSSQSPISVYGAAEIPYLPSVLKTYVRGELILYIVNNNLVGGETYNLQVLINGAATSISGGTSSVAQFTSGSTGFIYVQFLTGSTAPLDRYSVQVGGAATGRIVTYTAVLRLFER